MYESKIAQDQGGRELVVKTSSSIIVTNFIWP